MPAAEALFRNSWSGYTPLRVELAANYPEIARARENFR